MKVVRPSRVSRRTVLAMLAFSFVYTSAAFSNEVTLQNDTLADGQNGNIQAGFVAGESASSWLTSSCDGAIVGVQVFWRSVLGTQPTSLESAITIFSQGVFPTPGGQLTQLVGPVMTDGVINEFRFLDENQTQPINVPVTNGQTFVVSFTFANTPGGTGASVVTDVDGCQGALNAVFAVPGGWLDACLLGVTGDFVIRAVVDCDSIQSCCFDPTGCVNLAPADCVIAGGFSLGAGTSCAVDTCFPVGACCLPDGSCQDDLAVADCAALSGTYQGDATQCGAVTCPQPAGACCLANNNCLEIEESTCLGIPDAMWAGPLTLCSDACSAVPTVSQWGLVVMASLVLNAGTLVLGGRRRPA